MEANEPTNILKSNYNSTYEKFITWCKRQNIETYSENVFLVYFSEKAKTENVSTLWKIYSILKSTFIEKHNLNIAEYKKLTPFIQTQHVQHCQHYTPPIYIFTKKQIFQFLEEAPDHKYLMWKICLMFGVAGACLPIELKKIMTYHIEDTDTVLIIEVPDAKTEKTRTFLITEKMFSNKNMNPINLYRKYLSLRPSHIQHDNFFIVYANNKCTTQPVGIQSMENISYNIASYLKIKDANMYNRYAFFNTSASLLKGSNSDSIEACLEAENFDDSEIIKQEILDTTAELIEITDGNNAILKSLPTRTLNHYENQSFEAEKPENCVDSLGIINQETLNTTSDTEDDIGKPVIIKQEFLDTTEELNEITDYNDAMLKSLPSRTLKHYERQHQNFITWYKTQNEETYSENVFLTYFYDKAKSEKSTTLWSIYSMLKSTFLAKHNINISEYQRLLAFIKQQNMDYAPKESKVFTREQVCEFLEGAPDDKYLMLKVCLIFGIAGACRIHELKNMLTYHIEDKNTVLVIKIPDAHSGNSRTFTVFEKMFNNTIKPIEIYRKYSSLRPSHIYHDNFFIYYSNHKCTAQPVGLHTIRKIPHKIASYLQIEDANEYTGHAFRKISGSLYPDNDFEAEDTKDYIDSSKTIKQDPLINTTENAEDVPVCTYSICIESPIVVTQNTLNITPELNNITDDNNAMSKLVKSKAQNHYEKRYKNFITWCENKNVETYSENAFLTYFKEKAKSQKVSTLWSTYSMLKTTFIAKHNIDISKYTRLTPFIKQQSFGYIPKKSNVFTREHVCKFLEEAPDDKYLLWKVCLIFGIAGACRSGELKNVMTHHITDVNTVLIIKIPDGKIEKSRTFLVMEKMFDNIKPIDLYRKYLSLRPSHIRHDNFFIFYSNSKCTTQPIGVHTIEKIPTKIASYLKIEDAKSYTGHAFRRSSASLLAESDSDIETNLVVEDSQDYIDNPEIIKQEPLDITSDAEMDIESPVITPQTTLNMIPDLNNITDDNNAMSKLVKSKAQNHYEKRYENFITWCENKNVETYSENAFLTYFKEKAKSQKVSTLWSTYSMLKTTFIAKHNIDISKYTRLTPFIKQQSFGYIPKKSNVFTREHVCKFLEEAPDDKYLLWKVCLIFGIAGACRSGELKNVMTHHITDVNTVLIIKIPDGKIEKSRTFLVMEKMFDNIKPIDLYRKYLSLRPSHIRHDNFFIFYSNSKCTTQPIGVHTIEKIPTKIASYLKIEDAKSYTGHAFRRSSASLLAESDSDIETNLVAEDSQDYIGSPDIIKQEPLDITSDAEMDIESPVITPQTTLNMIPDLNKITDDKNAMSKLKSKAQNHYEKRYENFIAWCKNENVETYSENAFLTYFKEKSKSQKVSTLWSSYSMLKTMFIAKHNIDIAAYTRLTPFIKQQSFGYSPKKSKLFTREQVCKFLEEAPDDKYLSWKVCLIFGIAGACRAGELKNIKTHHITDANTVLIIKLPHGKSGKSRTFIIMEKMFNNAIKPIDIYRKYLSLRPSHIRHDNFFIFYSNNRCTIQPIGVHNIEKIPTKIASYLKIEDANNYTGHAFRRSSASLLAESDSGVGTGLEVEDREDFIDSPELIKQEPLDTASNAQIDIESPVILNETLNTTEKLNEITDDNTTSKLLPLKSQINYHRQYQHFMTWCKNRNVKTYSENVFLSYFKEKAKSQSPSTLWCTYSMLKTYFIAKHNIDISAYTKLTPFLKKPCLDYAPKETSAFTRDQVCEFLEEAPDNKYLMWKVCLIFGIAGACHVGELKNMMTYHIEDTGSVLIIKIPHGKSRKSRTFIIKGKMFENIKPIDLYRKYSSLRPSHIKHDNFFIYYGYNKCSTQPVGIGTIGKIPNNIATYLKIGDTSNYTGLSFRKSSASLLADSGLAVL